MFFFSEGEVSPSPELQKLGEKEAELREFVFSNTSNKEAQDVEKKGELYFIILNFVLLDRPL